MAYRVGNAFPDHLLDLEVQIERHACADIDCIEALAPGEAILVLDGDGRLLAGSRAGLKALRLSPGAAGTDGAPVLTLEVTGADGDMCMAAEPDTLKPIVATPEAYYVNVHTADFPKGAIRGQLAKKP